MVPLFFYIKKRKAVAGKQTCDFHVDEVKQMCKGISGSFQR